MDIKKSIKPTEGELEILSVLWEKRFATVRDVHEAINQTRESGYTTTLKLMQIMHEKGLVSRNTSSKVHVYEALVDKEATQDIFLNKMIQSLYAGSSAKLVLHALGNAETTDEELEQIKQFINALKDKK